MSEPLMIELGPVIALLGCLDKTLSQAFPTPKVIFSFDQKQMMEGALEEYNRVVRQAFDEINSFKVEQEI